MAQAIAREKQIKGRSRSKKIMLINESNSHWLDLSEGWYDDSEDVGPESKPHTREV